MPARQMFSGVMQHCKSLFLREFQEVRECSPDLEARLASVPGLLTSLFEHVSEMKQKRRKKNKVRFSALAEIFPDREEEEGQGSSPPYWHAVQYVRATGRHFWY